jgi:transmembrane sensor
MSEGIRIVMPRNQGAASYNEQIRDAATEWFIQFCENEVDEAARRRFTDWLRASPEHVRAYLEISAFWEAAGGLVPTVNVDDLVQLARREGNVVALNAASRETRMRRDGARMRRFAIAACALLALSLLASGAWWQFGRYPTYTTRVAELRSLTLDDGSVVQLSASSRVRVRFSQAVRGIELLQGQALFLVAHNAQRPFIVESGSTRVRAVGTRFDVNRDDEKTVVTVVSGRVEVSAGGRAPFDEIPIANAPVDAILLAADEQVVVSPQSTSAPVRTNAASATAWTEGKLVFDGTPMREVVRQFNRYSTRPLVIDDPKLLDLHVTGTFRTSDSLQIVRFLSMRFNLVVHDNEEGIRLGHE